MEGPDVETGGGPLLPTQQDQAGYTPLDAEELDVKLDCEGLREALPPAAAIGQKGDIIDGSAAQPGSGSLCGPGGWSARCVGVCSTVPADYVEVDTPGDTAEDQGDGDGVTVCGVTLRTVTVCGFTFHPSTQKYGGGTSFLLGLWFLIGLVLWTHLKLGPHKENYTYVDAVYLMAQIITTVGYGDMRTPQHLGLLFMAIYVLIAVVVLSAIVTVATDSIVQKQEKLMGQAVQELKAVGALQRAFSEGWKRNHYAAKQLSQLSSGSSALETPFRQDGSQDKDTSKFLKSMMVWLWFVVTWAMFFALCPGEDKEWIKAFYMAVITMTTVGFGDVTPNTEGGKIFATVWMLMGVAAFANMVAKFTIAFLSPNITIEQLTGATLAEVFEDKHFLKVHHEREKESAASRKIEPPKVEEVKKRLHKAYTRAIGRTSSTMTTHLEEDSEADAQERGASKDSPQVGSESGSEKKEEEVQAPVPLRVSRNDFIVHMLKQGIIDSSIIDKLDKNFDELDSDQNGFLDEKDVMDVTISGVISRRSSSGMFGESARPVLNGSGGFRQSRSNIR